VNPRKYRKYVRGDILVSGAGVVTNFFLAFAFSVVFVLLGILSRAMPGAAAVLDTAQRMMVHGIWLNLILCFFNLIPIPPLDGSHIMYHALPPKAGAWYRDLQRFGYLPIFALMFLFQPVVGILLTPAYVVMRMLARFIAPYQVVTPLAGLY
jgi:Zn-dependent protease